MNANELLKMLKEDAIPGDPKVGPVDGVISADDVDHWPHEALSKPVMLNRTNAWLAMLTQRPYINPFSAVTYLKTKLAIGGIDFPEPKFLGEVGSEKQPITQWGKATDFSIVFDWVVVRGWYTISAELKGNPKEALNPSEAISESTDEFHEMCESATASGYSLLSVLGNGGRVYTHTQGHKLYIKQHGLKGASFVSSAKNATLQNRSGYGTNSLSKHLAMIHGRSHGYKGKYEFGRSS